MSADEECIALRTGGVDGGFVPDETTAPARLVPNRRRQFLLRVAEFPHGDPVMDEPADVEPCRQCA